VRRRIWRRDGPDRNSSRPMINDLRAAIRTHANICGPIPAVNSADEIGTSSPSSFCKPAAERVLGKLRIWDTLVVTGTADGVIDGLARRGDAVLIRTAMVLPPAVVGLTRHMDTSGALFDGPAPRSECPVGSCRRRCPFNHAAVGGRPLRPVDPTTPERELFGRMVTGREVRNEGVTDPVCGSIVVIYRTIILPLAWAA
jgi:hypothetical protein